jgi:hypothetical protein
MFAQHTGLEDAKEKREGEDTLERDGGGESRGEKGGRGEGGRGREGGEGPGEIGLAPLGRRRVVADG